MEGDACRRWAHARGPTAPPEGRGRTTPARPDTAHQRRRAPRACGGAASRGVATCVHRPLGPSAGHARDGRTVTASSRVRRGRHVCRRAAPRRAASSAVVVRAGLFATASAPTRGAVRDCRRGSARRRKKCAADAQRCPTLASSTRGRPRASARAALDAASGGGSAVARRQARRRRAACARRRSRRAGRTSGQAAGAFRGDHPRRRRRRRMGTRPRLRRRARAAVARRARTRAGRRASAAADGGDARAAARSPARHGARQVDGAAARARARGRGGCSQTAGSPRGARAAACASRASAAPGAPSRAAAGDGACSAPGPSRRLLRRRARRDGTERLCVAPPAAVGFVAAGVAGGTPGGRGPASVAYDVARVRSRAAPPMRAAARCATPLGGADFLFESKRRRRSCEQRLDRRAPALASCAPSAAFVSSAVARCERGERGALAATASWPPAPAPHAVRPAPRACRQSPPTPRAWRRPPAAGALRGGEFCGIVVAGENFVGVERAGAHRAARARWTPRDAAPPRRGMRRWRVGADGESAHVLAIAAARAAAPAAPTSTRGTSTSRARARGVRGAERGCVAAPRGARTPARFRPRRSGRTSARRAWCARAVGAPAPARSA